MKLLCWNLEFKVMEEIYFGRHFYCTSALRGVSNKEDAYMLMFENSHSVYNTVGRIAAGRVDISRRRSASDDSKDFQIYWCRAEENVDLSSYIRSSLYAMPM